MQVASSPIDVLCVGESVSGLDEGFRVSAVTGWTDPDRPEGETIDCLVVDATGDRPVETVEQFRGAYPSTPLVAFVGDDGPVERVLDAGASELVRSAPAETPPPLLRQRVETVCENTVSGVAQNHPRTHESLLQQLSENLQDVVWVYNPTNRSGREIEFVSASYEDVWGRPQEHALEGGWAAFEQTVHPADRDRVLDTVGPNVAKSGTHELTYRILRPDGEVRWIRDRVLGTRKNGETHRVLSTSRDITEQKQRKRELERQNDLFMKAQDIADVGAWEYNLDGPNLWTEQVYELYGLSRDTRLELDHVRKLYHPDDRQRVDDALDRAVETGDPFDLEVRMSAGDDETRWVRLRGDPQFEDGEVVRVRGVVQEITDRVEREHRLQAERDLVGRILETSPVGILVSDPDLTVRSLNEEAARIMGVEPAEVEGQQPPPEGLDILTDSGEVRSERDIAVNRVKETGEPVRNEEYIIETPAGERRHVVADVTPLYDDGDLHRLISTVEDVTDRVEREQALETQRNKLAQLDRVNRLVREVDAALVGATSRAEIETVVCEQLTGSLRYDGVTMFRAGGDDRTLRPVHETAADPRELMSMSADAPTRQALETGTACVRQDSDGSTSTAAVPFRHDGQTHGVLVVRADRVVFDERELAVLDRLGRTVGHAIAAVESRERETALASMYEATQALLAAESRQAVCHSAKETVSTVLDPEGVGVFLFDDEENVLELAAGTDRLREFYDGSALFGPGHGDSIAWQTYLSGESRFLSDVRRSDHVSDSDTAARSGLFVPLGEHGVLVLLTDERVTFGERKRRPVELFAAATEAALDRVTDRADIRERDRRLAEQTTRLNRLDELLGLVNEVETTLRRAATPGEVERGLCEQLADTEPYALAWVGAVPPDGDTVEPRSWAEDDAASQREGGYLDDVSFGLDGSTPAARALSTGETVHVPDITDRLRDADWARAAVEHDYQSVLAVPLCHEDEVRGVFVVYATVSHVFDDTIRDTLEQLGALVPDTLTTLAREHTTLPGPGIEVELDLPNPGTVLSSLADTAGTEVTYHEVTPIAEDRTRVQFTLTEPPIEEILALETELITVESLDVVEHARDVTFQATLTGTPVVTRLLACGAVPTEVLADPTGTTATVRLPPDTDVRGFIERVRERYPDAGLRSRRDVGTKNETEATVERALARDLTDRQREVLRKAYRTGFFESPRGTTGVELADRLGVSQPTVTHHLREAQRRLFDALFDSSETR